MAGPTNNAAKEHIDSWNEYRRLVLAELERLDQMVHKLVEQTGSNKDLTARAIHNCKAKLLRELQRVEQSLITSFEAKHDSVNTHLKESDHNIQMLSESLAATKRDVVAIQTRSAMIGGGIALLVAVLGVVVRALVAFYK